MKQVYHFIFFFIALSLLFINSKVCAFYLADFFYDSSHCGCCESTQTPCDHEEGDEDHHCFSFSNKCDTHPPAMPMLATGTSTTKSKNAEFSGLRTIHYTRCGFEAYRAAFHAMEGWFRRKQHFPEATPLFIQHAQFLI